MKDKLTMEDIVTLAETRSPEAIRREYGPKLDSEGLAFLDDFERIGSQLDGLSEQIKPMLGPPPQTPELERISPVQSVWRGPMGWVLSAALLLFFLVFPQRPANENIGDGTPPSLFVQPPEALLTSRNTGDGLEMTEMNLTVYQAHMARGRHLSDQGGPENLERAYWDFKLALLSQPEDKDALRELIMVCEALGLEGEMRTFTEALKALEK